MMFLLPVMFAGALQVGLPTPPALGIPAPAESWTSDPPPSRLHRAFQNTTRLYLVPTLSVAAFNTPSVLMSLLYPPANSVLERIPAARTARGVAFKILAWHQPSYAQWRHNVISPPVFPDRDNLIFNFGIHPWVGSAIHLAYRNHGVSFFQSLILVMLWATFWEYVAEAAYERPALNDILANSCGALMGEAIFQAKRMIMAEMPAGVPRNVLLAVVDPFFAIETSILDVADHTLGLHPLVVYLR
jgi:hypothetical protein